MFGAQYGEGALREKGKTVGYLQYASASYGLRVKVKLPERQKPGSYREPDYPYKYIPENTELDGRPSKL